MKEKNWMFVVLRVKSLVFLFRYNFKKTVYSRYVRKIKKKKQK